MAERIFLFYNISIRVLKEIVLYVCSTCVHERPSDCPSIAIQLRLAVDKLYGYVEINLLEYTNSYVNI